MVQPTKERYGVLEFFLSTRQVAERFGVSIRNVQYYIRRGILRAGKVDYVYLVHEADLPNEWPPS